MHLAVVAVPLAVLIIALVFARRHTLRFGLLILVFLVLGIIRSPESEWNMRPVAPEVAAARKFPVVLDVEVPMVISDCTDQVKAAVGDVVVGYPDLVGRHVVLRGLELIDRPAGSRLQLIGNFKRPGRRLNPFALDKHRQFLRKGLIGYVDVEKVVPCEDSSAPSPVLGLRRRLETLILASSSPETRGMLEALLLGRRSNIDRKTEMLMMKAGTYHVLAISGLHVGIVVILLTASLSMLRLGRAACIALAVACVLCYVIFTGARPSAQRAWMFFLLVSGCRLLQWKVDYPNCVCAAGTVLLLAFPHLAWDVGFNLSLAAVFGITLLVPQLAGPPKARASFGAKLKHYVMMGLAASFSAQVFTLPVLLYHFGRVSLIGPVSNLVVLPLVTLIVAAGMEATLTMSCSTVLAGVFMRGAAALVWVLFRLTELLVGFSDPLLFPGRPLTLKILVYLGLVAYVALFRGDMNGRLKLVVLLVLCAFLIVTPAPSSDGMLVLTFLYVGDGDACLIEMPNGSTLLIDAGAYNRDFDAGRSYVLPYLAMKGLKRIDSAVVTHSHNDHYGGLLSLMESISIGELLIGATDGESGYVKLLEEARHSGVRVRTIGQGDTLFYDEARIEVLHPPVNARWEEGVDPNAQSIVCRLVYHNISVLLTGDLTPSVQHRLAVSNLDLSCDILKVPHHGAPEGVDSAFAGVLGARYAVISAGSRFPSHPCPETIDMLECWGMQTLTTVSDGAVTVTSDGQGFDLRCENRDIAP